MASTSLLLTRRQTGWTVYRPGTAFPGMESQTLQLPSGRAAPPSPDTPWPAGSFSSMEIPAPPPRQPLPLTVTWVRGGPDVGERLDLGAVVADLVDVVGLLLVVGVGVGVAVVVVARAAAVVLVVDGEADVGTGGGVVGGGTSRT